MEKDPKKLFIGILIGIIVIVLWAYIPYEIKERRQIKAKQQAIDSLNSNLYKPSNPKPEEKLYYSKEKYDVYFKDPVVIHQMDGSMDIIYKDTFYIHASQWLYVKFLLDATTNEGILFKEEMALLVISFFIT